MNRKEKLKLENIKKANELLDKGHSQQYPTKEPVELQPSNNVRNSSKSFVSKMNNLKESTVSTTSRKERANWSTEAMQDLEAFHPELKKDLITMEDIDKEIDDFFESVSPEVDRINEIMGVIVEKKKHSKATHDDKDGAFTVPVKVKGVDDVEGDDSDDDDSEETTTTSSGGGSSPAYHGDMGGAGEQDVDEDVEAHEQHSINANSYY